MTVQIEQILGGVELFRGSAPEELAKLAARCRILKVPARRTMFTRGDPGDRLYIVASGLVRIGSMSPEGRPVTYGLIRPGEVFGEIAVLDGGPRTADAIVMEASELIVLDRRDLMAFLDRSPSHYSRLLNILCQRVRTADELIEDLFFLAATNRLAKHLLMLGNALGESSGGEMTLKISQQEIADHIGISRERVNKLLASWEQTGLVALWRGRITLKNIEALNGLVGATKEE